MDESTEREARLRAPRHGLGLWVALLGGPLAWMLGLNAQYSLVRVACDDNSLLWMHGSSLFTLLLAAGGGWVAWREWNAAGGRWPGEEGGPVGRARFMAAMGLLGSALFGLAIVAQWVASLFLHPCMAI